MLYIILCFLSLISLAGAKSTNIAKYSDTNRGQAAYENGFVKNEKKMHVALEASYLYWQIGTHTCYADIYGRLDQIEPVLRTSGELLQRTGTQSILPSNQVGVLAGNSIAQSGFSVRASLFFDSLKDWEFGAKFQYIKHTDDVLGCVARLFTTTKWIVHEGENYSPFDIPNLNEKLNLPPQNNGLLAILSIGTETSAKFMLTDSIWQTAYVAYQLDKVHETINYTSLLFDVSNLGLLLNCKHVQFGLSIGLELTEFENIIEVRGAQSRYGWDFQSFFGLDPLQNYYFAYKLENKPFLIGPFVQLNGALRFEKSNHKYLLNGSLFGAGLYTKNKYKQFYSTTSTPYEVLWDTGATINETLVNSTTFASTSCDIKLDCPDFCYDPQITLYHAKAALGVKYETLLNGIVLDLGLDWEINCFFNFFDRSFRLFSQDDLAYQGLSFTIGARF